MYPSDKVYDGFKTEFTELDACVEFSPMHTLKEVDDDGNEKAIGVIHQFDACPSLQLCKSLRSLRGHIAKPVKDVDTDTLKALRAEWPEIPEFLDSSPNALYDR